VRCSGGVKKRTNDSKYNLHSNWSFILKINLLCGGVYPTEKKDMQYWTRPLGSTLDVHHAKLAD
jgi:hypothetical protein